MRRFFLPFFYFVANTISYGASAASSALFAGIITFVFVLYYSQAIQLPGLPQLIRIVAALALLTTLLHGLYFGILHKIGIPGFTRGIRLLNRAIVRGKSWFSVTIRDDLNADEYRQLHRVLCYLPRENAIVSVVMVSLIVAGSIAYLLFRRDLYNNIHLIQVGVIAVIAGAVHAGFTAVITELVTGEMRSLVKKIMYNHKVEFQEIALANVRSKILLFIMIMVAALFVSNFMAYYDVAFPVLVRFSVFAVLIAAMMAYMLFSIVLQSLREIEAASVSIRDGLEAQLFPQALDREFINVATGLNSAVQTIRDYQHNLERKVAERTAELSAANAALNARERTLQTELDFAAEIQKGIIPAQIAEWNGLHFYGYYQPMEKVSGDYYDVFPAQGNRLGVLMADVSGHGVPAALITTMAKVAFARSAAQTHSPAQTFRDVNSQLTQIITTQDYLTAFYLTFDETHHFYYSNASHPPARIVRAARDGNPPYVEVLDTGGLFVGALPEANDSYEEKEGRLFAGDRLFLYTDGVTEIRNADGEEFGVERFEALLLRSLAVPREEAVSFIIGQILDFAGSARPSDDISLLMAESNPLYAQFLQIVAQAYLAIERGERHLAAQLLDDAIALYSRNLVSLGVAGTLSYELGRIETAERYFNMYLAQNRQNADIFYYLSSIAILKQEFARAEQYARAAIELRQNYALAYNNLAIACFHLGKNVLARYAMEKALAYDPDNSEIRKNAESLEVLLGKT
ncbi:MAG: SpoIIE family protein phosphatase [Turneriella sp.]|nr:SpoIIE family protein phosphatase [Turneriella sp.]